jgi:hypothetical protein
VTIDDVRAIKNRHTSDLFSIPQVVGVGTGMDDDGFHITVYLTAPADTVPASLDGCPVKTMVTGRVVAS